MFSWPFNAVAGRDAAFAIAADIIPCSDEVCEFNPENVSNDVLLEQYRSHP